MDKYGDIEVTGCDGSFPQIQREMQDVILHCGTTIAEAESAVPVKRTASQTETREPTTKRVHFATGDAIVPDVDKKHKQAQVEERVTKLFKRLQPLFINGLLSHDRYVLCFTRIILQVRTAFAAMQIMSCDGWQFLCNTQAEISTSLTTTRLRTLCRLTTTNFMTMAQFSTATARAIMKENTRCGLA